MSETQARPISRFSTLEISPRAALEEIARQILTDSPALVALFVSPRYDREETAQAIAEVFGSTLVVGCTTAGEISPQGYRENGITGFALPSEDFTVESDKIDRIGDFEYRYGAEISAAVQGRLEARSPGVDGTNTFAFLLVDGMSRKEEPVTAAIHPALGDIQLFGGSAGDGSVFSETWIYFDGSFETERVVLTLVRTSRPFSVFQTQHFVASDQRLVVTASDPVNRTVSEIDGERATAAYARHLGLREDDLAPSVFACHPVVVKMGGEHFVRSIMRHHGDGSLEFACAIDQGVVLRLAQGVDMVENLSRSFASIRERIGPPELIVGCDCLFRRVEAEATHVRENVDAILRANNVVGFTTYGEQYNSVHVNQTLTGVAIGPRKAA